MEAIITALITGGLALVGVIVTNASANAKIEQQLQTAQAVTDTKLEALTEEVKKHNSFAERIPVLEVKIEGISARVSRLEAEHYENDR